LQECIQWKDFGKNTGTTVRGKVKGSQEAELELAGSPRDLRPAWKFPFFGLSNNCPGLTGDEEGT